MTWTVKKATEYKNDFNKEHYDKFTAIFPKGKKDEYKRTANKKGYKGLSEYINALIEKDMAED